MIKDEKSLLRAQAKKIRNGIENTEEKSRLISQRLFDSSFYKSACVVLAYSHCGSEVKTKEILLRCLEDNKKLALPRCIDNKGNMKFYYVRDIDDIRQGMYGIWEPKGSEEAVELTQDSLCIVPALSFDKKGFRLGYGKGYYDRFLSRFPGISVGLAFSECMTERLPADEYDKKVNFVITDLKIYNLN